MSVIGLALLPLETHSLPGWPVPPSMNWLSFVAILLGVPAVIVLVIVLLVGGPALRRANRVTSQGVLDAGPAQEPAVGGGGAAAAVTAGHDEAEQLTQAHVASAGAQQAHMDQQQSAPQHAR